jgi:hypothetical protein
MKAVIDEVTFSKEIDSKFGKLYSFKVKYDGEVAIYRSKNRDQKNFVPGKEAEFTEETQSYKDKNGVEQHYKVVKLINQNRQSNFGKALQKEQARYSAMCVSYAKDLVIAGRIQLTELQDYSWVMFELIREMDKTLDS